MELFLNAFTSYFVFIDPIGVALIFTVLTAGADKSFKMKMAIRAVLFSFCLVVLFGFGGEYFLNVLGIDINSFRIAGGLLLFYTAFTMLTKQDMYPVASRAGEEDVSVYPLAIPLMAGPGCLTLTVLLFNKAREVDNGQYILLCSVVAIFTISFISFCVADKISAIIGKTGNAIVKRLLGVILAALSIQFVVDGIRGIVG